MRRVATAAILSLIACGQGRDPDLSHTPRPDGVALWLNHEPVPLAAPAVLADLVNLDLFGDLRPGQTISDVRRQFGEPHKVTGDHAGTYYHYTSRDHEVAVAHLTSSSAGVTWENWSLYAYPQKSRVDAVFRGPLLEHLQKQQMAGDLVLSVVSSNVDQRISADVRGSTVSAVRWYVVAP